MDMFEQSLGDGEGQGSRHTTVRGVTHNLVTEQQLLHQYMCVYEI